MNKNKNKEIKNKNKKILHLLGFQFVFIWREKTHVEHMCLLSLLICIPS